MSYSEKLRDPRWHRKRSQILRRDNYRCRDCGSDDEDDNLHVHHCYYHGDPWNVEDLFLLTLCESCHLQRQEFENSLRLAIGKLSAAIKPADVERFRARFRRILFEFENEISAFNELVHDIAEGNRMS